MKYLLLSLGLFLVSCSWFGRKETPVSTAPSAEVMQTFEKANLHLDQEEYAEAARLYDKILKQNPATELDLVILFNSGTAYEGLKRCKTAAGRYRKLVRIASNRFKKIEARALLRLSYNYECLGNEARVISSLTDAWNRRKYLSVEKGRAEVPARLAAAYARLGNQKMARKYYLEAERGLKLVHGTVRSELDKRLILARTLFFMGNVEDFSILAKRPDVFFDGMKQSQVYLLKSMEMNEKNWSGKSTDALSEIYRKIWDHLSSLDMKDGAVRIQGQKIAFRSVESIEFLKASRFPDDNEPKIILSFFNRMVQTEQKFRAFLAENATETPLTEEAKERDGLRRSGKVISSGESVLEKKRKTKTKKSKRKKGR